MKKKRPRMVQLKNLKLKFAPEYCPIRVLSCLITWTDKDCPCIVLGLSISGADVINKF